MVLVRHHGLTASNSTPGTGIYTSRTLRARHVPAHWGPRDLTKRCLRHRARKYPAPQIELSGLQDATALPPKPGISVTCFSFSFFFKSGCWNGLHKTGIATGNCFSWVGKKRSTAFGIAYRLCLVFFFLSFSSLSPLFLLPAPLRARPLVSFLFLSLASRALTSTAVEAIRSEQDWRRRSERAGEPLNFFLHSGVAIQRWNFVTCPFSKNPVLNIWRIRLDRR